MSGAKEKVLGLTLEKVWDLNFKIKLITAIARQTKSFKISALPLPLHQDGNLSELFNVRTRTKFITL
ncbi:MAG: hypothetical protein V3U87_09200 [Methylococcaceae bacterium]